MIFKKEEAFQHALCMELTTDRFQLAIVNPKDKKIVYSAQYPITSFTKEGVAEVLTDPVLKYDFATFSITVASERNTLIPVDLFSHSAPKDIFKLNYPEPIDNLDYNRIPELGIVNIYEIALWIKSLFVIRIPRIKIVHQATVLLKGVFDQPTFNLKLHVHVADNEFYLLATNRSKLDYFNRFDYKEIADLIYYIQFVIEQKEYDPEKMSIHLYGVSPNWEHYKQLNDFFNNKVNLDKTPEKGAEFILAKQLLCV